MSTSNSDVITEMIATSDWHSRVHLQEPIDIAAERQAMNQRNSVAHQIESIKQYLATTLTSHPRKLVVVPFTKTIDTLIANFSKLSDLIQQEAVFSKSEIVGEILTLLKSALQLLESSMNLRRFHSDCDPIDHQVNDQLSWLEKTNADCARAIMEGRQEAVPALQAQQASFHEALIHLVKQKLKLVDDCDQENAKLDSKRIDEIQRSTFGRLSEIKDEQFDEVKSLAREMMRECFNAVVARHGKTARDLSEIRLEIQKEHLKYFRMLYFTHGERISSQEKKIEGIDRNIRAAHIHLEFCVETFDPAAKKHAAAKKELTQTRHQQELVLDALKTKQAEAREDFIPTEKALDAAGFDYVHPVDELEEEKISRRSTWWSGPARLTKNEEIRITAEREEIKREKRRAERAKEESRKAAEELETSKSNEQKLNDKIESVQKKLEEQRREVEVTERMLQGLLKEQQELTKK